MSNKRRRRRKPRSRRSTVAAAAVATARSAPGAMEGARPSLPGAEPAPGVRRSIKTAQTGLLHRNPTTVPLSRQHTEDTVSDPPASPDPRPGTRPAGKRPWLGKLSVILASSIGSAAVNDLSGTLGYHGLAGGIALLGVVTAATWIRGLDPRARLPRRALWLFLAPAAGAATAAAFSSGTVASILTAAAAILTVGAVLITKELQSAARLLAGAALIVGGAAVIAGGTASIADGNTPLGAAIIPAGAALLAAGAAHIGDRDTLTGAALIAAGAALIAAGAGVIATGGPVTALGNRTVGITVIFFFGVALITDSSLAISADRRPRETALSRRDRLRRLKGLNTTYYAATYAFLTAILAGGSTKFPKGVTSAGAAHITERDTLLWVAFIAFWAAEGALWAWAIGPRTIASRARQAIDWATKPPHP